MKVLVVNCCLRGEKSNTARLLAFLITEFKNKFPDAEYIIRNLEEEPIEFLTYQKWLERKAACKRGEKSNALLKYACEFAEADFIIVAAPFWDLNFPALLKIYFENISVDGITFGCSKTGMFGLCKASHLIYLVSRGFDYSKQPELDQATPFLKALCKMYDIPHFTSFALDGMDVYTERVDSLIEQKQKQIQEFIRTL